MHRHLLGLGALALLLAWGVAPVGAEIPSSIQPATLVAQESQEKKEEKAETEVSKFRHLEPFDAAQAPALTEVQRVRFQTSAGDLELEIYPQAAPNAAQRFIELVKAGFYDQTPIFRVVSVPHPFVAQFGINWRPGMVEWKNKMFQDDPSLFHLTEGTLAFAKAGPNTNSTQVFINYGDNDFLRGQNFSTFGIVTKGLDIARNFKSVGSADMGLDQGRLWSNGEAYLNSLPLNQQPTMIIKAELIEDEEPPKEEKK